MDITLSEGTVSGSVTAPASKSYAQRAIAAALLCEGESVLSNMVQCNDTRAALQVAADLGAKISAHEDTYTLHGGLHPRKRQLNIGESGLATRLFTPITALCTETITLTGKGSILKRPISMMEEPLRQLGATVSSQGGYLPIHIRGAIRGGNITVDGSLSSQFITGLLMALPLAAQDTTLTVNDLKSRPYIDMTIGLLKNFGIDIKHNDYRQFFIEGGQRYVPTRYRIEGDWSGASCLLVAGATAGRITVENLNPLSLQADTAIIALPRPFPGARRARRQLRRHFDHPRHTPAHPQGEQPRPNPRRRFRRHGSCGGHRDGERDADHRRNDSRRYGQQPQRPPDRHGGGGSGAEQRRGRHDPRSRSGRQILSGILGRFQKSGRTRGGR